LREGQIEASIAASSRRWASRSVLHTLFAYPFKQVGAHRLLVQCSEANAKAMKMNRQLGFTQEGRLRHLHGPDDGILWGMLRDECKWIKGQSNGQVSAFTTTSS
jgi:RimJ/RimL family protein N-acetyltransferase